MNRKVVGAKTYAARGDFGGMPWGCVGLRIFSGLFRCEDELGANQQFGRIGCASTQRVGWR